MQKSCLCCRAPLTIEEMEDEVVVCYNCTEGYEETDISFYVSSRRRYDDEEESSCDWLS